MKGLYWWGLATGLAVVFLFIWLHHQNCSVCQQKFSN